MSSWFSSIANSANSLAEKVKESMPALDNETLQKLTLTTPELKAARQKIIDEEKRKESVRDRLAGMLPWETRDPERDILVDECRDAILKLSASKRTFTGPWKMPTKGIKASKKRIKDEDEDDHKHHDEEEEEEEEYEEEDVPSQESLDQLSKLEPLPPLLGDFDLDSHVGLIQRLLKEDPQLVVMQSTLSGGGERERIFWKNFFFHCAFTRYEAGLSIDEIWSEDHTDAMTSSVHTEEGKESVQGTEEETITFESGEGSQQKLDSTSVSPEKEASEAGDSSAADKSESGAKVTREGSDFDMMDDLEDIDSTDNKGKKDGDGEAEDYELDELEAEIARELED